MLAAALIATPAIAAPDDPSAWMAETDLIDWRHPAIQAEAARVALLPDARARAVALHARVGDMPFGFRPALYEMRASEVLAAGIGFCNTKSTLFVALLRASGIPARARFMDIDARILDGVLDAGTPFLDHSWTEVWIEGRWVATDAYVVDPPLLARAQARLRSEGRALGYAAHLDGTTAWDGRSPAFSQLVDNGRVPALRRRDHGPHRDIAAFLDQAGELAWNRKGLAARLVLPFAVPAANARVAALRSAPPA